MQLNITSLRSNAEVLEALAMTFRPIALVLQETEVQTAEQISTSLLQSYRVVSLWARGTGSGSGDDEARTLRRGRRGGGVATLVRRDVLPYETQDLGAERATGTDFEYVRTVIRGIAVINVYAPPTTTLRGLDELVAQTKSINPGGELVLCGDFNAAHDMWNHPNDPTRRCHMKKQRGEALYDVMVKHRLVVANGADPTTCNGSVLDLTLCTAGALCDAHEVVPRLVSGVHYPVLYDLRTKVVEPGGKKVRRMRSIIPSAAEEGYCDALDNTLGGVSDSIPSHDVDRLADHVRIAILKATAEHGKRFDASSKKSQAWLGEEWFGADDLQGALTESRAQIIEKRNEHFQQLIGQFGEKGGYNPKHLYDVLKLLNRKFPTTMYTGPDVPEAAAGKLRELFAHGDARESADERRMCREHLDACCAAAESPKDVTDAEVSSAILSLKPHAAGGPDGITTKQIICAGKSAAFRKSMAALATNALKHGKVPRGWKKATIVPIEKESGGYRPISLINVADKVVQKIVTDRLMRSFDNKKLQFGFQKGWNAEALLQQLVEKCEAARRDGKQCAVISVDIKAAFDRLRASHVASALLGAGVDPHIARYCHKYCTNRKFQLRFATQDGDHTFGWYDQHAGCVQGSVLGPSLFLFCIQELLERVAEIEGADPLGYADDSSAVCVGKDLAELQAILRRVSDVISEWGAEKHWKFSTSKCWILPIAARGGIRTLSLPNLEATIAGESVKCVASAKVLGVTLDTRLCFEAHAERILEKVTSRSRAVMFLSAQRWGVDQSSAVLLYKTIMESLVVYAGGVWIQRATKKSVGNIQTKLLASLRVCLRVPRRTPLGLLYYRSGCLSLLELGYVAGVALEGRLRKLGFAGNTRYAADFERLLPPDQYVMSDFSPGSPNDVFSNWGGRVQFSGATVRSDDEVQQTMQDGDVCVFTDGSVKEHAAAHAYVIASSKEPGALETGGAASSAHQQSYHVELRGVVAGMDAAAGHVTAQTNRVVLFTDSLSSLEKLKTRRYDRELEEGAAKAINRVAERAPVVLVHAKGHAGILWNEAADAIAGNVADASHPETPLTLETEYGPLPITVKDARATVKKEVMQNRRRALLQCADDDISFAALTTNGFAKERPQIRGKAGVVQMYDLLQMGLYDAHLYWGEGQEADPRPWCRFCGGKILLRGHGAPVAHLVYECPAFTTARGDLDCSNGIGGCFVRGNLTSLVAAIAEAAGKINRMTHTASHIGGCPLVAPKTQGIACH